MYQRQQSTPPVLRLLITAHEDCDGVDFSLSAARQLAGDRLIVVVNATGRDLAGYARRHEFAVIGEDRGGQWIPSRSLTQVTEAFATLDADEVGCVVVLDTNRLYRATRCSVRNIEDIKRLSPGHWDDTNEALGLSCETLTRAGIPSIFLAPVAEVYGTDDDGEQIVVGHKPHAWKDLGRQAHASVLVSRSGRQLRAEVLGDDGRLLGSPGDVVEIDGAGLGARFAAIGRGGPGVGGATLEEATASELGARARRAHRRRSESERVRDRLVQLAPLRAYQGPDAWALHVEELNASHGLLAPEDAELAAAEIGRTQQVMGKRLEWARAQARTLERTPYNLHELGTAAGPSIHDFPFVSDHGLVDAVMVGERLPSQLERAEVLSLVRELAREVELWDEIPMALLCSDALAPSGPGDRGPSLGRSWGEYSTGQLLRLVQLLVACVSAARRHDVARRAVSEASPTPSLGLATPDVSDAAGGNASEWPRNAAERDEWRTRARAPGVGSGWPPPETFAAWPLARQRDSLPHFLHEVGVFGEGVSQETWDQFRSGRDSIGPSRASRRWSADECVAIYRAAMGLRTKERTAA